MTIWRRYLFLEILKTFSLVLFSCYFLFILIDFSAHAKVFHHVRLFDILCYYLFQFSKNADLLAVVAFLIATVKVLTTLNLRNEIVAMTMAGHSFKKLLFPLKAAAFILMSLLYINSGVLESISMSRLEDFEQKAFKGSKYDKKRVHAIVLSEGTLLYRLFDKKNGTLVDAFWIKSIDEIYKCQSLTPFVSPAVADVVEKLVRNEKGELVRVASFDRIAFPSLLVEKKKLAASLEPQCRTFSDLFSSIPWKETLLGKKTLSAQNAALLFYKLLLPLSCFWVVFGTARDCLHFTRGLKVFFLYAGALFGILTFFILVRSLMILGESQVIAPIWGALLSLFVPGIFCGWRYAKL